MTRLLHLLVALYPPAFRRRYGRELHDLVDELSEHEPGHVLRSAAGLVGGAACAWWQCSRPATVAAAMVPIVAAVFAGISLMTVSNGRTAATAVPMRIEASVTRRPPPAAPHGSSCMIGTVCADTGCTRLIYRPAAKRAHSQSVCVRVTQSPARADPVLVRVRAG